VTCPRKRYHLPRFSGSEPILTNIGPGLVFGGKVTSGSPRLHRFRGMRIVASIWQAHSWNRPGRDRARQREIFSCDRWAAGSRHRWSAGSVRDFVSGVVKP
jgi:hypothetical protein